MSTTAILRCFIRGYCFKKMEEMILVNTENFITRNDRNRSVTEYNYGDIEGLGLDYYDIPVKAEFCYNEAEELIYENYDNLIFYIENNLIPNNIMKRNIFTDELSDENSFYYIRLKDILILKLSEKEVNFVIDYLGKKDIFVLGFSTSLEGVFDNYVCIRAKGGRSVSFNLPLHSLSSLQERELFLKYKENPSLELKQKIALNNSRLVSLQCNIYSKVFNVDVDELFGYGMMGLLKAIPLFDISLGNKFSTFALYRIKREMIRGIGILKGIPLKDNNESYYFLMALNEVERANGFLSENTFLSDELIINLIDKGIIVDTEESRKQIICWCNLINHLSLDELFLNDSEDMILGNVTMEENEKNYYSSVLSFEIAYHNVLKNDISRVIDTLDDKRREVLKMRYGLSPYGESLTLEEVGKLYGVSYERVRQLEKQALEKLKEVSKKRVLKDYYD